MLLRPPTRLRLQVIRHSSQPSPNSNPSPAFHTRTRPLLTPHTQFPSHSPSWGPLTGTDTTIVLKAGMLTSPIREEVEVGLEVGLATNKVHPRR